MNIRKRLLSAALLIAGGLGLAVSTPQVAQAQSTPFIGEVATFAFNFCPAGWAQTLGQLLPIQTNQALFALIGTYYGGDGMTTFALPYLPPMNMSTVSGGSTMTLIRCIAVAGVFPSRS